MDTRNAISISRSQCQRKLTRGKSLAPEHLTCNYLYAPPWGALSDGERLTSDVYLSVAYIGPNSTIERPRKTKIGTEVAHVTRDSDTAFKVKRSKVNLQWAGHIVAASHTGCSTEFLCLIASVQL